jgi:cytochrome c biogenesis protein CcdA
MLPLILLLAVALPIAWIVSEFQDRRWLRITAGCAAIAMSFLVAAGVGSLERFNSNAWYGFASKKLIDTTVEQVERGDTERLLRELKTLQEQFQPTYENRARYDQLVDDFVTRIGK